MPGRMDMAFLQRAQRMLGDSRPAPIDHGLLLAALAGRAAIAPGRAEPMAEEPLIELLTGGPDWRRAAVAQGGCFNRAEAGRGRNAA
jgi:hypothetical protein